jgi:hypothetical protein
VHRYKGTALKISATFIRDRLSPPRDTHLGGDFRFDLPVTPSGVINHRARADLIPPAIVPMAPLFVSKIISEIFRLGV